MRDYDLHADYTFSMPVTVYDELLDEFVDEVEFYAAGLSFEERVARSVADLRSARQPVYDPSNPVQVEGWKRYHAQLDAEQSAPWKGTISSLRRYGL